MIEGKRSQSPNPVSVACNQSILSLSRKWREPVQGILLSQLLLWTTGQPRIEMASRRGPHASKLSQPRRRSWGIYPSAPISHWKALLLFTGSQTRIIWGVPFKKPWCLGPTSRDPELMSLEARTPKSPLGDSCKQYHLGSPGLADFSDPFQPLNSGPPWTS